MGISKTSQVIKKLQLLVLLQPNYMSIRCKRKNSVEIGIGIGVNQAPRKFSVLKVTSATGRKGGRKYLKKLSSWTFIFFGK